MGPNEYTANGELLQRDLREKMPEVGKIFAAYVQRCKQANAMDFDDLLTLTFQLFRDHEDIRRNMLSALISFLWMSIRIPIRFR